jgi:hypothetical protein
MKNFIALILFIATSVFAVLTLAISPSFADQPQMPAITPITVNALRVLHLTKSPARSVSVFYVSGSPPALWARGGFPTLRTIWAGPVNLPIGADGSVTIPQMNVPRKGVGDIMSYIAIAVHSNTQTQCNIMNPNEGTAPTEHGPVDISSLDQSSFNNERVIYLHVSLAPTRASVSQLTIDSASGPLLTAQVNGSAPVFIDLGNIPNG